MRTVRVYSEQPLRDVSQVELAPEAARHVAKVLRMRTGDELVLFDGSGTDYTAAIVALDKRAVTAAIKSAHAAQSESPLRLTLWHGICRGSRMDYVIQKATELGVSAIQPVIAERGVVKVEPGRARTKVDHWRKIAISAAEQSGRSRLPVIHPPAGLQVCLDRNAADALNIMLDPEGTRTLMQTLGDAYAKTRTVTVLTGPEGGFTDDERAAAKAGGFLEATLGPRILRSETAPIAALAILQSYAGDLA